MKTPKRPKLNSKKRPKVPEELTDTVQLEGVDEENLCHAARYQKSLKSAEFFFENRYCINRITINETSFMEICKDYSALIYKKGENGKKHEIQKIYENAIDYIYELFDKYDEEEKIFTPSSVKIVKYLHNNSFALPENIKDAFKYYLIDPNDNKKTKTNKFTKLYQRLFSKRAKTTDIFVLFLIIAIILILCFHNASSR
ncbi:MAG: hypothetical protein U9O87_06475 [Verrucomicrobiota bacterium]|nr:hypothetical protein [Verrucomicrobiota bacterium]